MLDWLRPLLLMFYAPARGMSEVRDRAPLALAALLALIVQVLDMLMAKPILLLNVQSIVSVLVQAAGSILLIGLIFVPLMLFVANLFDRRGSFTVVLQQEYAAIASCIFYAWAAAGLVALPLLYIAHTSGIDSSTLAYLKRLEQVNKEMRSSGEPPTEEALAVIGEGFRWILLLLVLSPLPYFSIWAAFSVRSVFRLSWFRVVAVVALSGVVMFPAAIILMSLLGWLFTSPFLIILLFIILRGYFAEMMSAQKRRAAFKQNLEAATLNPADSSAHYNLGLLHLQRSELDAARQRFERAIEIDPEEIDAHFQLGRIARAQNLLPDAIKHFEQVVARNDAHAQYEIWREIGATYIAAGQFEDARDALEKFLDRRPNDPEGLYLMGRALAGMGRQREAAERMQACIEAVKTAPAYKYRTEKRWLNEAQQFLRSQV